MVPISGSLFLKMSVFMVSINYERYIWEHHNREKKIRRIQRFVCAFQTYEIIFMLYIEIKIYRINLLYHANIRIHSEFMKKIIPNIEGKIDAQ